MSRNKLKSNGDAAGTTVLFKVLCCTVRLKTFSLCVFMYLCEKYYKPSTVSTIYPTVLLGYSRLTLLDL